MTKTPHYELFFLKTFGGKLLTKTAFRQHEKIKTKLEKYNLGILLEAIAFTYAQKLCKQVQEPQLTTKKMDSTVRKPSEATPAAMILLDPYNRGENCLESSDSSSVSIVEIGRKALEKDLSALVNDMRDVRRIPCLGAEIKGFVDLSPILGQSRDDIANFNKDFEQYCASSCVSSIPSSHSLSSFETATEDGFRSNSGQKSPRNLKLCLPSVSNAQSYTAASKSVSCNILQPTNSPLLESRDDTGSNSSSHDAEPQLVLELLRLFMGINGDLVRWENKSLYFTTEASNINPSQRTLAIRLKPLISAYKEIHIRTSRLQKGKCSEALKSVICDQLHDFDVMVADLESKARRSSVDSDTLSLHQLECLLFDSRKLLNAIIILLDRIEENSKTPVSSIVHEFVTHGDPQIQKMAIKVLSVIAQPILRMIRTWLFSGAVSDEYGEFFVEVDLSCGLEDMWMSKFRLREKKIPAFISHQEADLIFRTGKNINFLADLCKVSNVGQSCEKLMQLFDTLNVEESVNDSNSSFGDVAQAAFTLTSERVLHEILTKERLFEHFNAIKLYLLHGQGDFYQYFIKSTRDMWLKPTRSINIQHVQSTLQHYLINSDHISSFECKSRVQVTRGPKSEMLQLWETFCLEYKTSICVRQIISPPQMDVYSRVFSFLWQLLRTEVSMKAMWIGRKSFTPEILRTVSEAQPVILQCHILIGEFNNFVIQVKYYAMSEAIESEWQSLMLKLRTMTCLEDIIKEHDKFIQTINVRCLQSSHASRILLLLEMIYSQIFMLEKFMDAFKTRIDKECNRRRNIADGVSITSPEFNHVVLLDFRKYIEECVQTVDNLKSSTRKLIHSFLKTAEGYIDPACPTIDLIGLCYRVDFNNFYAENCEET